MKQFHVLIFPSGAEGAIDIYKSLRYNIHFCVYGCSGKKNYTDFLYPEDRFYYGDERLFIEHPDFRMALLEVLERFQIDFIIPTFDAVALRLAEIQSTLPAKVVTSPYLTTLAASNKKAIYQGIRGTSFAPRTYHALHEIDQYPIFVKPTVGMGSQGAQRVDTPKQLSEILAQGQDMVLCEYLPGEELSVDCFTDRHRRLLFSGVRTRERVWHGITFRSESRKLSDKVRKIAEELNERFEFRGAWFFQIKQDRNGDFKLLEFSTRQATNSAFYGKLGVNFSVLSLFDAMDVDVSVQLNDCPLEQERCLHAAYRLHYDYENVYVDFDDTLILHSEVNTLLMRFLYQCVNKKKKIYLLTKHSGDLDESLSKYRIPRTLFDEVIWIQDDTEKALYIQGSQSILIDNYFLERMDVKTKLGIPVFDVDAVDGLIDDSAF